MKFLLLTTTTVLPMLGFVGAACPSGAHVKTGSGSPGCFCTQNGGITCNTFTVCGVGKTGAALTFQDAWSADVQCRNKGGNIVEVKTTTQNTSNNQNLTPDRNGCFTVFGGTLGKPSDAQFTSKATCPNGNWQKVVKDGSASRTQFIYKLVFDGCGTAFRDFSDLSC